MKTFPLLRNPTNIPQTYHSNYPTTQSSTLTLIWTEDSQELLCYDGHI